MPKAPKLNFRSTVAMLQQWTADMPRELGYDETGAKDHFGPWQTKARKKLRELLGFWPTKVIKPKAWLLCSEQVEGFTREQWALESPFGDHIFLYRLVPDGMVKPEAIMLALHGHGTYGADPVCGVMKGRYGEEDTYTACHYDYGAQFARRGYLVYAPCQRGFSQRCDLDNPGSVEDYEVNPQVPPPGSSCVDINARATLLGTTDIGLRVQDAMQVITWIKSRGGRSRPHGEGKAPLGCVGLSGGGHTTEFLAAVDTRVDAASIQGYFCYWTDQIVDLTHCNCNYVPSLMRYFEQDDVCGLICPRPLLVTTADNDGVAPIKSFRKAFRALKGIYNDQGVAGNLAQDTFEGGHEFSGRKAFAFFDEHLRGQ
jgi:hypothetical protein